ncbi:MAG: TonB-dependent receptor [Cetobacterium sp.]
MYKKMGAIALVLSAGLYGSENEVQKEISVKLNESTITSERYEIPVVETAKNVTVISADTLEKRGYQDIEKALVTVPGLSYSDGKISIRGQVPSQANKTSVILIDGIPQNGLDNSSYDLDFIPIEQVERIEVIPSGGAIMYGGRATAGVINIITKGNEDKKYWGSVGYTGGSFNERKYKLNAGTRITGKLALDIKYINQDKEGYVDGTFRDAEFVDIGTEYDLEDGKIGFKYIRNDRKSNWAGGINKKQYEEDRRQNPNEGRVSKDIQDKYIFNFDKKLTKDIDFKIDGEYRERDYSYPNKIKTSLKNTEQLYTNSQIKYSYSDKNHLILGGDYSEANVESDSHNSKTGKHTSHTETDYSLVAGYLLNRYYYKDFIFTQGFRVERSKFDNDKTDMASKKTVNSENATTDNSYELTANYMFSESTSGYLSFNRVSRSPNLTEYGSGEWKGGKDPESQTVDTLELGTKTLIGNVYIAGAIFYIGGDKEIVYDPSGDQTDDGYGSWYNMEGRTKRLGIELSSEQYFSKLTTRQGFAYIDNEITSGKYEGKEIPGISKLIYSVGLTYEPIDRLSLNWETLYHGKAYPCNNYENNVEKVGSYTLTNVSAVYFFGNGVSLGAGVNNLFGEEYSDYVTWKKGSKSLTYYPSPERTYYVNAEYKF